jgi:hypothetical protein
MRIKSILQLVLMSCFLVTLNTYAVGQTSDSIQTKTTKKVKVLPVPTFGYEPETKTKVGAVTLCMSSTKFGLLG